MTERTRTPAGYAGRRALEHLAQLDTERASRADLADAIGRLAHAVEHLLDATNPDPVDCAARGPGISPERLDELRQIGRNFGAVAELVAEVDRLTDRASS